MIKRPRRGPVHSPGAQATEHRIETREIRSYESEYVNALWHLDFHHGSLRVLLDKGDWAHPLLLGIIDDHSRLCCHGQWYLAEGAEELCHGLCQALQKRALPRALMSDNGSAMLAAETTEGLARLGIVHEKTLPYAPFQNGKQESFWNGIEGRLLPMLEGVADLTLARLNEATLAWIEMEYNRSVHSELGEPLRFHRFTLKNRHQLARFLSLFVAAGLEQSSPMKLQTLELEPTAKRWLQLVRKPNGPMLEISQSTLASTFQ